MICNILYILMFICINNVCVCEQRYPALVNNAAPEHFIKYNFTSPGTVHPSMNYFRKVSETQKGAQDIDTALVDPS